MVAEMVRKLVRDVGAFVAPRWAGSAAAPAAAAFTSFRHQRNCRARISAPSARLPPTPIHPAQRAEQQRGVGPRQ